MAFDPAPSADDMSDLTYNLNLFMLLDCNAAFTPRLEAYRVGFLPETPYYVP